MNATPMSDELYPDIRDGVRALCAGFPAEYHRQVDAQRAYPEAFVNALTQAGWLAALIRSRTAARAWAWPRPV